MNLERTNALKRLSQPVGAYSMAFVPAVPAFSGRSMCSRFLFVGSEGGQYCLKSCLGTCKPERAFKG
jgi:hypothetical protein